MRIFIDEAGNFVAPANGQSLFSFVLALVIPSSIENDLFEAFLRLRDTWPNNAVEIKGSKLDESQAAQLRFLTYMFNAVSDDLLLRRKPKPFPWLHKHHL